MDRIETEKTYPQKVEVVNELKAKIETSENDPLNVAFDPRLVWNSGSFSSLRTAPANTNNWVFCRPTSSNLLNLHISSLHVVNAGVGTVFPLDLFVYNLTSSAVSNNVSAVYSSYSSRYTTASSIVIFYETISYTGTLEASSYSSTD